MRVLSAHTRMLLMHERIKPELTDYTSPVSRCRFATMDNRCLYRWLENGCRGKRGSGALSSEVRNVGVCSRNNRVAGSPIKCVFFGFFWGGGSDFGSTCIFGTLHKNNGGKTRFDLERPINRIE